MRYVINFVFGALIAYLGFSPWTWQFWTLLLLLIAYGFACKREQ